eukprot:980808-Amorphochlora_amoeboformis.AAC.1
MHIYMNPTLTQHCRIRTLNTLPHLSPPIPSINAQRDWGICHIQYIHLADQIIWLKKNLDDGSGMVECTGSYQHLMKHHEEFRKLMLEQGQS